MIDKFIKGIIGDIFKINLFFYLHKKEDVTK